MNNWIKKDLKYNWHPYTQMKDCEKDPPILIEKAKGTRLYDHEGRFYYDTISSWWCNIHGHNHPNIKKAIKKQLSLLDHVLFAGFTHKNAIELAERLISLAPRSLNKAFFSDNGSTAVETALKMSFQYWQNIGKRDKTRFICLDRGYHGDTIGAMSVSGVDLFNGIFKPLFFSSYKSPAPYCYRCPMGKQKTTCNIDCLKPLEDTLKNDHQKIAALILEPLVMAAGGMIIYPGEYLKRIERMVKKYNIHLILDEIATGFGRTGKMFACEYVDADPDFMCLSKGLTSGSMALGATLTTNKVYEAFYDDDKKKTFYHGHTYTANPIACSVALASLDIFKKENTLRRIKKIMSLFHKRMEDFRKLSIIGDVRYIGMIGAMELVKNRKTKEAFGGKERIGLEIYKEGLKRNILLRPLGNIIYLFLPLCITECELDFVMNESFKVISKVSARYIQEHTK